MSRALQRQRQHRGVLLVATSKLRRLRMSHTFIATPAHAVGTARETHDVARNVRRVALVREPAPVRAAPAVVDRGVTAFSVRTPQAPLDGTEEEKNPLRYITDQGKEYELMAKQRGKNIRKALGFTTSRPPTTPMGDYNTGEILGNDD